jgi:solute carrier family 25 protein 16
MSAIADGQVSHGASTTETTKMSSGRSLPPPISPEGASDHAAAFPIRASKDGENKKIPKQSWQYAMRSGVAGGLAACAAKTVVGPLDRVKILFQASNPEFAKYTGSWTGALRAMRDIYRSDGGRGLYRGHSATLLRIFPYGGIKFLAYEQVRALLIHNKDEETHIRRFLAGSIAGCFSVFATYPLEVIRVRLAFETKSDKRIGLRDICRTIYNEKPPMTRTQAPPQNVAAVSQQAASAIAASTQAVSAVTQQRGFINFFRGFTPTLWGMIPYAGSSFVTHDAAGDFMRKPSLAPYTVLPLSERSQRQLAPDKPAPLRAWAELATGALAGLVSQTLSYPLEVVRRRMQVGGVVGDGHRLTMTEVTKNIYKAKGFRGFYVGLGIGYVKVVPMVATSFYVYERMKVVFGI